MRRIFKRRDLYTYIHNLSTGAQIAEIDWNCGD